MCRSTLTRPFKWIFQVSPNPTSFYCESDFSDSWTTCIWYGSGLWVGSIWLIFKYIDYISALRLLDYYIIDFLINDKSLRCHMWWGWIFVKSSYNINTANIHLDGWNSLCGDVRSWDCTLVGKKASRSGPIPPEASLFKMQMIAVERWNFSWNMIIGCSWDSSFLFFLSLTPW